MIALHFLLIFFFDLKKNSQDFSKEFKQEPIFLEFIEAPSQPNKASKKVKSFYKKNTTPKADNTLQQPSTFPSETADFANFIQKKNEKYTEKLKEDVGSGNKILKKNNGQSLLDNLPASGKLSILVYYGGYKLNATPIGKGHLQIIYPTKETYEINLVAKAIGWASIFSSKPLFFKSKGVINNMGLSPKLYKENTPKRGESYVKVNNLNNTLYFSSTKKLIRYQNPYLQDPLSLIFQLAWQSQKNSIIEFRKLSSFYVFNRKKLKEIMLTADLPEEIVLPGGTLVEAIKIKSTIIQSRRPGIMTFWLDTSDNFLPVRISYKDEKSKKTLDFLVIREDLSFSSNKVNNGSNLEKKHIKKINPHHYLPSY